MKRVLLPGLSVVMVLLVIVAFVVRQQPEGIKESSPGAEIRPAETAPPANVGPAVAVAPAMLSAGESKTVVVSSPVLDSVATTASVVTPVVRQTAAKELKTADAHVFLDGEFGVGGEIPDGWSMRSSARWGVRQNTIWFRDPLVPTAAPSMYYKINEEPTYRTPEETQKWMYDTAVEKERQRVAEGRTDYKNREEMSYRMIGERQALTWSATYTRNGEPWVENLTRLYSPAGTVLFFLHAPATDIDAAQASFNTVIESTVMPSTAPKP
jgi:hypothetical protein